MFVNHSDVQFKINIAQIFVKPEDKEKTNVVRKVNWWIEFKLHDLVSIAYGSSNLQYDGGDFVEAESLTKEKIISWCIDQELFNRLLMNHSSQLYSQLDESSLVEWEADFTEEIE